MSLWRKPKRIDIRTQNSTLTVPGTVLSSAVKRQLSKFKQAVGRVRANFPAFAASL